MNVRLQLVAQDRHEAAWALRELGERLVTSKWLLSGPTPLYSADGLVIGNAWIDELPPFVAPPAVVPPG